jgi:hypothetical protein
MGTGYGMFDSITPASVTDLSRLVNKNYVDTAISGVSSGGFIKIVYTGTGINVGGGGNTYADIASNQFTNNNSA